ncbi:MAG: hypothetical protein JRJ62_16295 [Deltaproteobacteria bacterium]|nr:hypothetical protein [Deltaproteobacteria bacterium]
MRTVVSTICLMMISVGMASDKSDRDSQRAKWQAFRGIKWETSLAQYVNNKDVNEPSMILLSSSDDGLTTDYTRCEEKMSIGKAKLSFIAYRCYKGKFYEVMVGAEKQANFKRLKEAVFAYYGRGVQENEFIEKWTWVLPLTKREAESNKKIFLVLKYNEFSEECYFTIVYLPIHFQYARDLKEAAEKAKDDF